MKICALADTHWMLDEVEVPPCDILLHAGDLQMYDYKQGAIFGDWWNSIEADIKVLIPGNHDRLMEFAMDIAKSYLDNTYVLVNDMIVVKGLTIAGIPHTPTFGDWFFMADDSEIGRYMTSINDNVDIILSHGPAYAIHDLVRNGGNQGDPNVGSKTLNRILQGLNPKKKRYMFHGHIHGYKESVRHTLFNNIEIYNVAVCDESYSVVHKPLVLEI